MLENIVKQRTEPIVQFAMQALEVQRLMHIRYLVDLAHSSGRLLSQVALYVGTITHRNAADWDTIDQHCIVRVMPHPMRR
eukprot:11874104-Karenia_brevis.AAC.1